MQTYNDFLVYLQLCVDKVRKMSFSRDFKEEDIGYIFCYGCDGFNKHNNRGTDIDVVCPIHHFKLRKVQGFDYLSEIIKKYQIIENIQDEKILFNIEYIISKTLNIDMNTINRRILLMLNNYDKSTLIEMYVKFFFLEVPIDMIF